MDITKAYFMLYVEDMDRAVAFYRDAVGLTERFSSPEWSELSWGDAVVALHGGRTDATQRPVGLGFEVASLADAVRDLSAAGAMLVTPPMDRPGEPIRLAEMADTEGNVLSLVELVG
jgi:predicted enzyme related to lactoylglutathione lyase